MDGAPDIPITVANIFWAVGIAATIATTAVGTTWALLKQQIDSLRDELTTYKGAKDWKLPETLRSLNEVSDKVSLAISEREQLDRFQQANGELTEEVKVKTIKLQSLEIQASELAEALKAAQQPTTDFELSEGETEVLLKPHLIVGVKSISTFNTVDVVIANNTFELTVAGQREVKHENRTYVLSLRGVNRKENPYTAKFSFAPK